MRIGLFTYWTQPRGSVVHAACVAEALAAQGHDVTLFALSKEGAPFYRELSCNVCLIPAAQASGPLEELIARRIGELVGGLRDLRPRLDVLHAQDCLAASALLEARERSIGGLRRASLVRTVHHVEHFENPYLFACQQRSIQEVDLVLAVSQVTAAEVWTEFRRTTERVMNGVDLSRFRSGAGSDETRRELRQALGFPPEAFIVLSMGGVDARKNTLRSLEAVARLCEDSARVEWLIVGDSSALDHGAHLAQFEERWSGLPQASRARISRLGTVSEERLTELYLAADVFLCPSEQEGWGLCVLEAMAARLPVIIPRQAPFTEYVPEEAAAFVDPLDARDIERALRGLERSPAARLRLGRLGRAVAERFCWWRSARRHGELYQRLSSDARARGRLLSITARARAAGN